MSVVPQKHGHKKNLRVEVVFTTAQSSKIWYIVQWLRIQNINSDCMPSE